MRKHLRWIGLLVLGVGIGWVIHRPKQVTASGPVPERVRVSYPVKQGVAGAWESEVRELDVRLAAGDGTGPLTSLPGARGRPWRFTLYWPGDRETVLVAAERE